MTMLPLVALGAYMTTLELPFAKVDEPLIVILPPDEYRKSWLVPLIDAEPFTVILPVAKIAPVSEIEPFNVTLPFTYIGLVKFTVPLKV